MAKIRLIKGKASITKRNIVRLTVTGLVIVNTGAVIYILLKIHNLI